MKDKKLDRLIAWLIDWLDWLTDCLTGSGIDRLHALRLLDLVTERSAGELSRWLNGLITYTYANWHIYRCKCMRPMFAKCNYFVLSQAFYFHADFSDCLHISSHMFKFAQTSYLQLLLCGQESFCNCVESLEGASVDSCLKMGCRGCAWLWYIMSPRTQLSAVWLFLVC